MPKNVWTKASFSEAPTARENAHRALAREAAAESIVLLENDGALPLEPCAVALYGAGAATTIKGGTGSGEVNERHSVTIWEGLTAAGFTVTTGDWLREYEAVLKTEKARHNKGLVKTAMFGSAEDRINIMANMFRYPVGRALTEEALAADTAAGADTCIYVVARQAGECSDRSLEKYEYTLEPGEIGNIALAAGHFKRLILAINVGGSIDLSPLEGIQGVNAVVFYCQQGMEGGHAFADILTGRANPSGCLTNTWPKRYDDLPHAREYSYLKGGGDTELYKEGIYVGYRYFDSFGVEPRYAFGFGRSYTSFALSAAEASIAKSVVTVKAAIANTGDAAGKKAVQLYLSCPGGKLARERQSLAAFAKSKLLAPGEAQELSLAFDLAGFAGYDASTASYILEPGDYALRLGFSSRENEACAVIALDGAAITAKCKNICPLQTALEEISAPAKKTPERLGDVPRLALAAADVACVTYTYEEPEEPCSAKVAAWMKELSVDDMVRVIMGTGVIDSSQRFVLPGAAASTTSKLYGKGIANVALCDGPAGLRVQRRAVVMKSGAVKGVDAMMDFMNYFPGFIKAFMFGNPEKGTPAYQNCTAFPVGTAMAQTWNAELVERAGDAIGAEMEEYGATFWLAPGMNIQRNPLCGRNYEYYSEDPLLTGKMAAAVTRGVQSHAGCYVTLKHYAANNQEHRRNRSDSVMSERALREIYLKGFSMAVREGGARGVMTSYNKINGVYAPNSGDLCTAALRNEWGFSGLVMTDWFSTGKDLGDDGAALRCGNDLIMPGGGYHRKAVLRALKEGALSENDLRRCCRRVLEAVASSQIQGEYDQG